MAAIFGKLMREKNFKWIKNHVKEEFAVYNMMVPVEIGDNWIDSSFVKILLKVPNIQALDELHSKIADFDVLSAYIKDNGTTQDAGENGKTLAIGPFDTDDEKWSELYSLIKPLKLY